MDGDIDIDTWIEAQNPPAFQEAKALSPSDGDAGTQSLSEEMKEGGLRNDAMHEAAFSYGAQTALAWRTDQIRQMTLSQEGVMDVITSFNPFVADGHMLLPSITESRNRFDLSGDQTELRSVNIQYVVKEEPKAISQPPTWRDYLWRKHEYPDPPHPAILPEDQEEQALWRRGVQQGWETGLIQAQYDFENQLNSLVRDLKGRITYRILEARNVVQRPVMQSGQPSVTRSEDEQILNAGETIHSITVPLEFNASENWQALWLPGNETQPDLEIDPSQPFNSEPTFKPKN